MRSNNNKPASNISQCNNTTSTHVLSGRTKVLPSSQNANQPAAKSVGEYSSAPPLPPETYPHLRPQGVHSAAPSRPTSLKSCVGGPAKPKHRCLGFGMGLSAQSGEASGSGAQRRTNRHTFPISSSRPWVPGGRNPFPETVNKHTTLPHSTCSPRPRRILPSMFAKEEE